VKQRNSLSVPASSLLQRSASKLTALLNCWEYHNLLSKSNCNHKYILFSRRKSGAILRARKASTISAQQSLFRVIVVSGVCYLKLGAQTDALLSVCGVYSSVGFIAISGIYSQSPLFPRGCIILSHFSGKSENQHKLLSVPMKPPLFHKICNRATALLPTCNEKALNSAQPNIC